MPYRFFALVVFMLMVASVNAQPSYPDKNIPGSEPKLFASGVVSDGLSNRDFSISPQGNEIYFTIQQPRFLNSTILCMQKTSGKWSEPEVAPFSGKYRDLEAFFSPDGNSIFFSSDRPVTGTEPKKDFDIWKISRLANGRWGEPMHLDANVNSDKDEFYPSIAKNGDLYFTVAASYGKGKEDIVMCKPLKNGGYGKPESLPETINSPNYEFNAFVDPDEQFILFTSYGRSDDMGGGDLYISHKDKDGNWLPAKHLPAPINSAAIDYCPYITPDKKYFFFTSARTNPAFGDVKQRSYQQIKALLAGPGNGNDDIYWMKFDGSW